MMVYSTRPADLSGQHPEAQRTDGAAQAIRAQAASTTGRQKEFSSATRLDSDPSIPLNMTTETSESARTMMDSSICGTRLFAAFRGQPSGDSASARHAQTSKRLQGPIRSRGLSSAGIQFDGL